MLAYDPSARCEFLPMSDRDPGLLQRDWVLARFAAELGPYQESRIRHLHGTLGMYLAGELP